MKGIQYRQGDVLIVAMGAGEAVPAGATEVPRDRGRVVLAYGEVTGHAHAIVDPDAVLLSFGAERFLKLPKVSTLAHEEHDPIQLPEGLYRIQQQREYTPGAIRNVQD